MGIYTLSRKRNAFRVNQTQYTEDLLSLIVLCKRKRNSFWRESGNWDNLAYLTHSDYSLRRFHSVLNNSNLFHLPRSLPDVFRNFQTILTISY